MSGAGVSWRGFPVRSSNEVTDELEQWQFVLGEGPTHDAFAAGRVIEAVESDEASWPMFREFLRVAGQQSVFAFPLLSADSCWGVLTLYRTNTDPMTDAERMAATRCAAASLTLLVSGRDDDFEPFELVQRATGVVMGQLVVSADEATTRIRAHAFSNRRQLRKVVDDILSGRLLLQR